MNDVLKKIRGLSIAPHDPETLKRWLEQEDALLFLEENASEDEIVVYAGLPHTFILEEYAGLTDAVLVCMFDFTRFRPRQFGG